MGAKAREVSGGRFWKFPNGDGTTGQSRGAAPPGGEELRLWDQVLETAIRDGAAPTLGTTASTWQRRVPEARAGSGEAARCAWGQGDESHCSSIGARRQTKRTAQGLPGEPECEKSLTRGRGVPLPPQNFGDFGSRLLLSIAVRAGSCPSVLPSNGRTRGRAHPRRNGEFSITNTG